MTEPPRILPPGALGHPSLPPIRLPGPSAVSYGPGSATSMSPCSPFDFSPYHGLHGSQSPYSPLSSESPGANPNAIPSEIGSPSRYMPDTPSTYSSLEGGKVDFHKRNFQNEANSFRSYVPEEEYTHPLHERPLGAEGPDFARTPQEIEINSGTGPEYVRRGEGRRPFDITRRYADVYAEEEEDPRPVRRNNQVPNDLRVRLLWLAAGVIVASLLGFGIAEALNSDQKGSGAKDSDNGNPQPGDEFFVSSSCFWDVHQMLENVESGSAWAGDVAGYYDARGMLLRDMTQQLADAGLEVNGVVQTETEQVAHGRESLENVLNGLMVAVPIAESLYGAGPAGPALSHNFQVVSASAAVGSGTDTTNKMHDDSQKNAERLSGLAQEYAEVLSRLSGAVTPVSRRCGYP